MVYKMTISERLIEIRGLLDRDEFGNKIGVSGRTVQRWELEGALPKSQELSNIAENFNVNIHWLVTGQGNMYIIKDEFHDQVGVGDSLDIEIKGSNGQGIKYNTGERQMLKSAAPDKPQHTMDQFGEASTGLREIFNSGDPILIPALQANIRAFRIAARRERQIQRQAREIDDLKQRVAALEEKLIPPEDLKKSTAT